MNALSTTLHQLLADNLPERAGKVALVDPDAEIDYATLVARVDRVAGYLQAQGIGRGDRVIVHLRKGIAEVAAMFAVARLGAVIVNVNVHWTLGQLAYVAGDCGARLVVCDARAARGIAEAGLPPTVARVLVLGDPPAADGFDAWDAIPAGATAAEAPVLDTELAMILYTSGSTGMPKGVMLSHRNILAGARSVARYLRLAEDDRLLSVLAYSFDAGLNQLTTMLLVGGTVVHQPVVMAAEIVRTLAAQRVTGFAGVPPLLGPVVRLLADSPRPLPHLRRVTNTGGRLPLNVLQAMPAAFPGAELVLMYGLTESFRSTYLPAGRFAAKMGAIGRAIPGAEVFVVVRGRGPAAPGEEGELVHRGPLVSLGYWGRPDLTREKIRPCPELAHLIGDEPVVWSGDVVRVDADGDLWFVGRRDAMIKTSGVRLSPDEVEDLVCQSGLVGDAVAYGVEDEAVGEAVHVAVAPLAGFSVEAMARHCRRVMPSYMWPRAWRVWHEPMPRTASGKLDRPEVRRLSALRTC